MSSSSASRYEYFCRTIRTGLSGETIGLILESSDICITLQRDKIKYRTNNVKITTLVTHVVGTDRVPLYWGLGKQQQLTRDYASSSVVCQFLQIDI